MLLRQGWNSTPSAVAVVLRWNAYTYSSCRLVKSQQNLTPSRGILQQSLGCRPSYPFALSFKDDANARYFSAGSYTPKPKSKSSRSAQEKSSLPLSMVLLEEMFPNAYPKLVGSSSSSTSSSSMEYTSPWDRIRNALVPLPVSTNRFVPLSMRFRAVVGETSMLGVSAASFLAAASLAHYYGYLKDVTPTNLLILQQVGNIYVILAYASLAQLYRSLPAPSPSYKFTNPFLAIVIGIVLMAIGQLILHMTLQTSTTKENSILRRVLMEGDLLPVTLLAVIGPITEEILFRGLFYGRLRRTNGVFATSCLVGLLFGLAHFTPVEKILPAAVGGFTFSLVYGISGNIWVPIVLHVLVNSFAVYMAQLFSPIRNPEIMKFNDLSREEQAAFVASLSLPYLDPFAQVSFEKSLRYFLFEKFPKLIAPEGVVSDEEKFDKLCDEIFVLLKNDNRNYLSGEELLSFLTLDLNTYISLSDTCITIDDFYQKHPNQLNYEDSTPLKVSTASFNNMANTKSDTLKSIVELVPPLSSNTDIETLGTILDLRKSHSDMNPLSDLANKPFLRSPINFTCAMLVARLEKRGFIDGNQMNNEQFRNLLRLFAISNEREMLYTVRRLILCAENLMTHPLHLDNK